MRAVRLLLVGILAAGCGSSSSGQPSGGGEPGARAVDRPAPGAHEVVTQSRFTINIEPSWDPCEAAPRSRECGWYRDAHGALERDQALVAARHEADTAPAGGVQPRVVAELALEDEARAEVVAWRAKNGETCALARVVPSVKQDLSAQRVGRCVQYSPCSDLCLAVLEVDGRRLVVAGVASAAGDRLRLTGGARVRDIALGPKIAGSGQRAVIAGIDSEWTSAALVRGEEVIAIDETLGLTIRTIRCVDAGSLEDIDRCMKAAAP